MIANETQFNEQWFDVFLYYALIGLNKPSVDIRIYSLNVLNTIAKHNAESILDITEKVHRLCTDKHWEIKAQCLQFAITLLSGFTHMSHLLVQKGEDLKSKTPNGPPTTPPAGGNPAAAGGDANSAKTNLNLAVDIIQKCFSMESPKSVQKIGLFNL